MHESNLHLLIISSNVIVWYTKWTCDHPRGSYIDSTLHLKGTLNENKGVDSTGMDLPYE